MSRVSAVKKRNQRAEAPYAAPAPQAMDDSDAPAPIAAAVAKKGKTAAAKAPKAKADIVVVQDMVDTNTGAKLSAVEVAATIVQAPFDPTVDPRPRHKLEYRALVAALEGLKAERAKLTKAYEQQLVRKDITKRMAAMETEHRARCTAETEAYLATLTDEQRKNDPVRLAKLARMGENRRMNQTRKNTKFGEKR
jgi:hypothetical protein